MQKRIQIEAASNEEALALAVEKFHVSKEHIFVNEIGTNSYEALLDVSLALEGKKYLENILVNLGVDYNIEVRTLKDESEIHYAVDSSENPLLIGVKGRTIEAIQALLKNLLGEFTNDKIVVTLDIGNYKENRKRQLEILATKVAKEVAQTKQQVKLKPMSAYERLIIHQKLADWRDVFTESEGDGEDRAVVIKPNLNK
jgi:spoIIIJ-associated protein